MKTTSVSYRIGITSVSVVALAGSALAFGRIDKDKFHILTRARGDKNVFSSEKAVKAVAECGFDLYGANFSREGLDNCQKYGIGAIPHRLLPWFGNNWKKYEEKKEIPPTPEQYDKILRSLPDHPAIVAVEFCDENSAVQFPYLAKLAEVVNRHTDNNINLLPIYATAGGLSASERNSQLGTASYEDYIAKYCKIVPTGDITFDNYVYGWEHRADKLLENLRIVADACLASRRFMWPELQAVKYYEKKRSGRICVGVPLTENRLRYQCNASLAFGAKAICWVHVRMGWWADHVFDEKANIANRPFYDRLKRVNGELRRQGDLLVKFDRTHTDFVDFDSSSNGLARVQQLSVPMSSGSAFTQVKAMDGKALLVGHFVSRASDGNCAACVVAAEDPMDNAETEREVRFRAFKDVAALGPDGPVELTKLSEYDYSFKIRSNHAVILHTTAGSKACYYR